MIVPTNRSKRNFLVTFADGSSVIIRDVCSQWEAKNAAKKFSNLTVVTAEEIKKPGEQK
jgi:hypothetical protein